MKTLINPSERIAIMSGDREISFSNMLRHITHFSHQTPAGKGTKTLIMSENREGWFYAAYAIWNNKGTVVPVDAGNTAHDVAYIINDCHPQAIWTSRSKESLVREAIAEAGWEMQVLLIDEHEMADIKGEEVAQITYEDDDTCLICYTSGTTGSPKGVMLSYENVMANVRSVSEEVPILTPERRLIVLLPLHHVLPLVGSLLIPMVVGSGVAISPSLTGPDIMATLQKGKIGAMIGVPRLWQTLFRGIKAKIDSKAITRTLYNICERVQSRTLSRLIFSSVRAKMGGHLDYCVSGGAALDHETAMGLKTLGLDVLEGYGMTETAPIIAFTRPDDIRPGCVGLPMPSVEVKLVDGELCARGRNVMQGYYNRPEETAEIIDKDGFVHTGDLATIDEAGRITITGRKKEIIVLSNGKNVNPSEIEEKLEHFQEIVKECAVTQQGDMLVAIIVPQDSWKEGKGDSEMEEIIKRDVLQPYNETVAPYKKLMSLFVYHGDLPRTRLDKLQRFKLQELLKGNARPEQPKSMEPEEKGTPEYEILKEYIRQEKRIEVHPTDNLETDLAMDSLDKVALQGFIEQSFGMKISADEIIRHKTVAGLAEHVAQAKTRMEAAEDLNWHDILNMNSKPTEKLSEMPVIGRTFTALCRGIYRLMFHPEVKGVENIPTDRPVIFAPNHQSYIDGPLVVTSFSKSTLCKTYFYAKKEHIKNPISRFIARNHNVVVMDMSTLKESISHLAEILQQGGNLVIFPEGTRTHDGRVGTFKKTFAILAKELNIPVVPVRIDGAFEAWPRNKKLPRLHQVSVEYLPLITPQSDESYDDLAARVRKAIENA